jgi:tetratricopeptide (TPR) repeat protein
LSPVVQAGAGVVYRLAGRYPDALAAMGYALALDSTMAALHSIRADMHLRLGRYQDAIDDIHLAHPTRGPADAEIVGVAEARLGRIAEARAVIRDLAANRQPVGTEVAAATICVAIGDRAQALDWLERAVGRAGNVPGLATDTTWNALRDEPRFKRLLDRNRGQ